jgi:alpha-beta hydrolase superfamily lysophospholipase
MKKKIFRWIKLGLLVYCVVGIALFYGQSTIFFHPLPVDKKTVYDLGGQSYTEVTLPYDKETSLNVVEFTAAGGADSAGVAGGRMNRAGVAGSGPDSGARGVVLYFHGNKNNITRYAPYAADFTRQGYEVWMMDYPGFGKSTGVFSEQKLYEYALVLYKLARSRWKPSQIILYGKSLGTGIAAQLADVRDCRRLILESPYYSLESVAGHYLPVYPWGRLLHYHFPTYTHLPAVTAPVTIFQGTSDWQTPYSNASRLKPLLKPGDEFVTIEGGGHNNLHEYPLFREKLDSVLMDASGR